ncbi:hypothetical protein [Kitasatospora sp. NPDC050463]|uniref:hypothetical protein n=1 Tax=Kitasatospora sp. NPDC050463 TaxID=3155786 RepID=UPI0033CFB31C
MSSKKRLDKGLRRLNKFERQEAKEVPTGDTLVDYIKLLYEMDQEAKHAAKLRKDGDAR